MHTAHEAVGEIIVARLDNFLAGAIDKLRPGRALALHPVIPKKLVPY
jgi:hypothetical protein